MFLAFMENSSGRLTVIVSLVVVKRMHRNVIKRTKNVSLKLFVILSLAASLFLLQKSVLYDYDVIDSNNINNNNNNNKNNINDFKGKLSAFFLNFQKPTDDYDDDQTLRRSSGLNEKINVGNDEDSHPLENLCKYPVLHPDEESIQRFVKHIRTTDCERVTVDLVELTKNGTLVIDREKAFKEFGTDVKCVYRSFAGALKPHITVLANFSSWTEFRGDGTEQILDDQIEVQCVNASDKFVEKKSTLLYRFAFAQVAPRPNRTFEPNTENLLSMDIVVLDSTSLNMMRRHMNGTLQYWLNDMGALHLEGYSKVADNSMVNLLPVLAGKRYGNQSEDWPSEYPTNKVIDLDSVPFIWKEYAAKGCATMYNDDPMHYTRGLFHYPWEQAKGWLQKPTDYYYRPWHVYHRRFPVTNSTLFCFGNKPYYELQLNLVEQMINRYQDRCHFSFSFFTDLPHDNPSNLERMDDTMTGFLKRLRANNALNNTVLVIMGDHGHRIAAIMYSFIGRIEERTPFFSIYFPEWFRRKHPNLIRTFRKNKNRLTSNYDVHQMLKDIVSAKFDNTKYEPRDKGISLFHEIPTQRTCREANIPEHHCTCLIRDPTISPQRFDANMMAAAHHVILNYTLIGLAPYSSVCQPVTDATVLNVDVLTTSQMIQHGMRNAEKMYFDRLKQRYLIGEIDYIEVKYRLLPTGAEALIRLQHDKKRKKLFVNVPPLVDSKSVNRSCFGSDAKNVPKFCSCI